MAVSAVSRSTTTATSSSTPTLRNGSKGASVTKLQQRLRAHGINVAVDGSFGPATRNAVIAFQKKMGLAADGVVGPKTWAKLNAAPASATKASSTPTLKQGARGAAVTNLQNRLRAHGFNIANDGSFGPATRNAVIAFQKKMGLAADGVVGPKTWAKLNAAPAKSTSTSKTSTTTGPTLKQGAKGSAVSALQQKLRSHGYNVAVDGSFGPATRNAVLAFQKKNGLAADGVVGPKTWAKLGGASVSGTSSTSSSSGGGTKVTGYANGKATTITVKSIGNGFVMQSKAADAFNRMKADAAKAGIKLNVNSAFRTMAQQQHLYNLYKSGKGNLAARPGYSNHQMGLSVDISTGNSYNSAVYKWLAKNASKYGFVNDVRGEPWHWTFRG